MLHLPMLKFKSISFLCLLVIFSFCLLNQAQASYVPKIYALDLKINEVNDSQINGEFTIWNSEDYYFSDLNYVIMLFKGTEFNELQLIDTEVSNNTFSVSPKETIAKSFEYFFPKNIITGDYTLRVQIITAKGSELGWSDQIISLEGNNVFLDILNSFSRVLVGTEKEFPLTGINASPEQDVIVFLKVKNLGDAITVIPNIKIFKRKYNMSLIQEYQDSSVTFAKGEIKEIKLTMPKLITPESYLVEVKFYQDNEQVSGIQYFRWVVEGEGAKILYIKTDKDSYIAGEEMKIVIDTVGPADLSNINDGKLVIVVYDQFQNIVTTILKDIELNPRLMSTTITSIIKKDLFNPTIEAKITKDGKVLDEYKIILPIFSDQAKEIEKDQTKNAEFTKYLIYLIPTVLLIILIIGFIFFKYKVKK